MKKIINYFKKTWKNKLAAIVLLAIGWLMVWLEKDATVLVMLSIFAIPLFFYPSDEIKL